jgi:hypothetical protein
MEQNVLIKQKEDIIAKKDKELEKLRKEQEQIRNKAAQVDKMQHTLAAAQKELEEVRNSVQGSAAVPSFGTYNAEQSNYYREELDKLKYEHIALQKEKKELEAKLKTAQTERKRKQKESLPEIKKEYEARIAALQRELEEAKQLAQEAEKERSSIRLKFAHKEQQYEELKTKMSSTKERVVEKIVEVRREVPEQPIVARDDSKWKKKLKVQKEKYTALEKRMNMIRQVMMQTVQPLLFLDDVGSIPNVAPQSFIQPPVIQPPIIPPPVVAPVQPIVQPAPVTPSMPPPSPPKKKKSAPKKTAPSPPPSPPARIEPDTIEIGGYDDEEEEPMPPPKKKPKKRKVAEDTNKPAKRSKPSPPTEKPKPSFDINMRPQEKTKAYMERTFEQFIDQYHDQDDQHTYHEMNRLCEHVWTTVLAFKRNNIEANTIGLSSIAKGLVDIMVKMMRTQVVHSKWIIYGRMITLLQIQAPSDVDVFIQVLEVLQCKMNENSQDVIAIAGGLSLIGLVDQETFVLPFTDNTRGTAKSKKTADARGEFVRMTNAFLCDITCRIDYRKTNEQTQLVVSQVLYAFLITNPNILIYEPIRKTCITILHQYQTDLLSLKEQNVTGEYTDGILENLKSIIYVMNENVNSVEALTDDLIQDLSTFEEPSESVLLSYTQYAYVKSFEMIIHYCYENYEWIHDELLFAGLWEKLFSMDQSEIVMNIIISVASSVGRLKNLNVLLGEGNAQEIIDRLRIIIAHDTSHNFTLKTQICAASGIVEMAYTGEGVSLDKLQPVIDWYEHVDTSSEALFTKPLQQFIMLYKSIKES